MTDQLSGGVVQPTDAQIDALRDHYKALGFPVDWYRAFARAVLALAVPQAPLQAEPDREALIEALRFYADGCHFLLHQPDAWDTVSGEPSNFFEDESCTATVEDGTLAKMALAGTPLAIEPEPVAQAEPVPVDTRCPACLGSEFPGWKRGIRCATCDGSATAETTATPPAEPAVAEQARELAPMCQRIMDLVDEYHEHPHRNTRYAIRAALIDAWAPAALASQSTPPPESAGLWYLQDTRSYVGNDVLWWAKDGKGYTTDVSKACAFKEDAAFRQAAVRDTDRPWPKAYIDGKTRPAVDMQFIKHAEALAANPTAQPDGGGKA